MSFNQDRTMGRDESPMSVFQPDEILEREKFPMRVVLLEEKGRMWDLWLPPKMEGKFTFAGVEELFSITAVNDRWIVTAGSGVEFLTETGRCKKMQLTRGYLISALMGDRIFSLYAEEDDGTANIFLPYYFERTTEITLGRHESCDMWCRNRFISKLHAVFRWDGRQWTVTDNDSKNGVYVNGMGVDHARLKMGDVIYIMGVFIIVGCDYFAVNNVSGRMTITSPKVRRIDQREYEIFSTAPLDKVPSATLFDRKPRKKYKLEVPPIELEMPPNQMSGNKVPLSLRMGSMAVTGGQALLTGNYVSALTSLVFPALTQGFTEKDRKEYEAKRNERYREYLKVKEEEIQKELRYESDYLDDIFPDLRATLAFPDDAQRLWERRRIDDDFLVARIGSGEQPMTAELRYPPRRFEMEPDHLMEEMYQLAEKPTVLHGAPITLSFRENKIVGIRGEHGKVLRMVRNLIAYFAVTHAYDEVKIAVFGTPEDVAKLQFTRYLRHFWNDDRSIRFLAGTPADAQVVAKYMSGLISDLEDKKSGDLKTELKKCPAIIAFVLDKEIFDRIELFKNLLQKEEYMGISLVTGFDDAPKECQKLIDLRSGEVLVDFFHPEIEDLPFKMDAAGLPEVAASMDKLSRYLLQTNEKSFMLPPMVTFLEMYRAGRVEHLNPMARWADNNPVASLAVPVGVGTDGNLFTLDLHEKRQGPHGLVAGMTGSGKSEFIITYILSMAVNFSPEEVAFILIDYKGGGLADAFEDKSKGIHLPHLVGTITNLDGAAIQRSLMSINSELKRRQAVFKKAKSETNEGTMDIYDYQKLYRAGRVSEPMPHLFIISDEFAELKKQQPEFMDELISTARIGRSLGVHLILATQKPGGVVNDQIWSNTKFRVCLKVQDRGDSMEMLKRPEAAELKHTGRFYLQVGYNEYFALGQSAWCGAGYVPQDEVAKEEDNSVDFIDTVGQTVLSAKPKVVRKKAERKQIVAIVQYLSDLAKRENIQIRSMWMEPLPAKLELHSLPEPEKTEYISAVLGTVDDPEHQTQFPMEMNLQSFHHMLLVGGSGSGKSTLLRTLLYSLTTRYSPEDVNFYIMDLSAGAMGAFSKAPHCGAYLTEENENDLERLLGLVKELVAERKKLFAEAEVFSFDAYRKLARLPLVLVIFDSWMNMTSFRKFQEINLAFPDYLREAANYGIRFILSVNHITEATAKIRQELDYRLILQPQDKFDYNDVLNVRGTMLPPQLPGRGVCVVEDRPLEFHVAVPNCMEEDSVQNARLKERMEELSKLYNRTDMVKKLPVLEGVMEYETLCAGMKTDRIPLGLSMKTMQEVAMPLQQLYTAALYFGNPIGIRPVLINLLTAFLREEADVIVMRRRAGTIFNKKAEEGFHALFNGHFSMLDCTVEDMVKLDAKIIENISNTKVMHRNAYCEQNGIPATDRGRTKKAARYIRQHSKPLFVLFESLPDFVQLEMTKEQVAEYTALFEQIKGYNVYFFGCFYPEDESMTSRPLIRSFMKEDFAMLFGGRFNSAWCTPITNEYRRMEKVNPRYDRFIMKYHNECHPMIMPCGELITSTGDPDESDIV